MTQKKSFHVFDALFAFLLLIAFLLFSLLLSGVGSVIYQKGTDSLNENYTTRTALAYLQEKLRQHDEADALSETTVGEQPALALAETKDGADYVTYIYYYDGALRELFTAASSTPIPETGSKITELSSFTFEELSSPGKEDGHLLRLSAADDTGVVQSVIVHTSCGN
ncbi:MAG: DUF4860 domain-containing protein [Lachnospiraceae bacterium]|nr:DUF4860 domain-containing protein [Lachnospiraceae bacterium]